jgi:hypothetical protein
MLTYISIFISSTGTTRHACYEMVVREYLIAILSITFLLWSPSFDTIRVGAPRCRCTGEWRTNTHYFLHACRLIQLQKNIARISQLRKKTFGPDGDEFDPTTWLVSEHSLCQFRPRHKLSANMMGIVINWIVDIHSQFKLKPCTLHRAVHIIYKFINSVSADKISKDNLQLVGGTALFVAVKFEEMYALLARDLVVVSKDAFTAQQLMDMQWELLFAVKWRISEPITMTFLPYFIAASGNEWCSIVGYAARYASDLTLTDTQFTAYRPSEIAAASVAFALAFAWWKDYTPSSIWTPELTRYTTLRGVDVEPCNRAIRALFVTSLEHRDTARGAVRRVYSNENRGAIAGVIDLFVQTPNG